MILVCGSVAIDLIGQYKGSFAEYEQRFGFRNLAVSLQLGELESSFGGCGMNVAWGLKQLEVPVIPLSVAGRDFDDRYRSHLESAGIDTTYINVDQAFERSATAFILTDQDGHQFTAFHSGASVSPLRTLPGAIDQIEQVQLALLAPEDAPIMLRQARELNELAIPIAFDPGQGLAEFSRSEALELIELSRYVFVNEHEWDVLKTVTGLDIREFLKEVQAVVITQGQSGAQILQDKAPHIGVPAVPPQQVVDPTGCGDAFRAGFLAGLLVNHDLTICTRMGCLCATFNLEAKYTQGYQFTAKEFRNRYLQSYGLELPDAATGPKTKQPR